MQFQFDGNQEYQWNAIHAVTRLFERQPLASGGLEFMQSFGAVSFTENGFGNQLTLSEEQIWQNVQAIQQLNNITNTDTALQGMHFSIEMETGTGKTYVYLRTIFELNKLYGFTKFVVVVPSVAIREGVLKNLQVTYNHFQTLYNRCPVRFDVYDSKNVAQLRNFPTSNTIQILVINIDSFTKTDNVINKTNDGTSGKRPVEFIQSCRPIVIIDEPQNMETPVRKKAIDNLHPLCTFRYSATHANLYNLLYSLNPVKAYDLGLVKQIEVDSVLSEHAMNDAFMQLEKINIGKKIITARIKVDCNTAHGPGKKTLSVKVGDDLYVLSNERAVYRDGFIITEINAQDNLLYFNNGLQLAAGESKGGMTEQVMRLMIQKTITEHLKKEARFHAKGIKVLSLFFIDKVKNYREYDADGHAIKGKYAQWFEEIFAREIKQPAYKDLYAHLKDKGQLEAIVHDGYFAQDGKGRIKDTNGETLADDVMYKLIMQRKEELLNPATPLRFIFSHSALREGWDNPNVFQICTLNETKSEIKKRQEIGRGLRLAVNADGQRVFDKEVNRLTVIANESYEDFAKALQQEIEKDCGVSFTGRVKDLSNKKKILLKKDFAFDTVFLELWNKIKHKTRYQVTYNSANLIYHAAKNISEMAETLRPSVTSSKKRLVFNTDGITGEQLSNSRIDSHTFHFDIPDVLGYIQAKTQLTRKTLFDILVASGRMQDIFINPQLFMDNAINAIQSTTRSLMTDGIVYEKVPGGEYEMTLFNDEEMEIYPDSFTFNISNPDKTIYQNCVSLDSGVEKLYAKDCETSLDVLFWLKLPTWFKIDTPVGTYNPDWAIVYKGYQKLYFVTETKSADQELRPSESLKIKCGKAHFNSLNIGYKQVSTVSDLTTL